MLDKENSVTNSTICWRHNSYKVSGNLLASLDAVEIWIFLISETPPMKCKFLHSWILYTTVIFSRATQSYGAHFNQVLLQLHEDMSVNHIYGMCRSAHIYTESSKKMDRIWNGYNLKSTGRIYTFGVLKCSEKFKVLDLP